MNERRKVAFLAYFPGGGGSNDASRLAALIENADNSTLTAIIAVAPVRDKQVHPPKMCIEKTRRNIFAEVWFRVSVCPTRPGATKKLLAGLPACLPVKQRLAVFADVCLF